MDVSWSHASLPVKKTFDMMIEQGMMLPTTFVRDICWNSEIDTPTRYVRLSGEEAVTCIFMLSVYIELITQSGLAS